jgi:hypothetical protein
MNRNLNFHSFWGVNNEIDMAHLPLYELFKFKPDMYDRLLKSKSESSENKSENEPRFELVPFGIVRNPYDRIWSAFQFERTANWIPRNPLRGQTGYQLEFDVFVEQQLSDIVEDQCQRAQENESLYLGGVHFVPQSLMLNTDSFDGNSEVDVQMASENILKQENLHSDFTQFLTRMDVISASASSMVGSDLSEVNAFSAQLKAENCSNLNAPPKAYSHSQYYNSNSIRIINQLYGKDFEYYGYHKIDPDMHEAKNRKTYFGGQSSGKI